MGIFDKFFNSSNSTANYAPKNEQEAWVAIMFACITVDGEISIAEIDKLCQTLIFKTMFQGHNVNSYLKLVQAAQKDIGSKVLIDNSVNQISEDNKATLFALNMELLLADGIIRDQEKEIAGYLTNALNLDLNLASKIVEVLVIKNKGNAVIL